MKRLTAILFLFISVTSFAQFPGPVGSDDTDAIPADSSIIVSWANYCKFTRGHLNISDTLSGFPTVGDSISATGPAKTNGVLSLGDGGNAILGFNFPICDRPGFDFVVFENAFLDTYLELAFVEVSSDGIHFVRFPSVSHMPWQVQFGPFDSLSNARQIHNLAGKYRFGYGTPFDLSVLDTSVYLDLERIIAVRVVDVVGSVNPEWARYDTQGNPINDPWPTPFPSCGFDLDAVGVIHENLTGIHSDHTLQLSVFPVPFKDSFHISGAPEKSMLRLYAGDGRELVQRMISSEDQVNANSLPAGIYYLHIQTPDGLHHKRSILKTD